MLSIFSANGSTVVDSPPEAAPAPPESTEKTAPTAAAEPAEFEIVIGRRQLSSLLFVATVVIVTFSAVSYLVGRSVTPREVSAAAAAAQTAPAAAPIPVVNATIATATTRAEPPIFADPAPRKTYIQMGAVEKGLAIIFAEGLRRRGLDGFVAPGPNEKLFRVLIGPFADEAAYKRVKNQVDQIGLNTFPRRYEPGVEGGHSSPQPSPQPAPPSAN
jgi:cell division septation protein DedD